MSETLAILIMLAVAGVCIFALDWISRTFTRICEEEALGCETRKAGGMGPEGNRAPYANNKQTHSELAFKTRLLSGGEG